jgi:AcrR family transcriptional regulator
VAKAIKATADKGNVAAKEAIIETAERLFAEGGINGVSMREISAKAKQGNHFAVQYHFGSRDGLVQAIFDYRMDQMEPLRGAMLADLEASERTKDAWSILEIILLPQLQIDGGTNHFYGNFLSQYLLRQEWVEFGIFGHEAPPNLRKALQLLRERVDYLPAVVAQRRLVNVSLMFLNLLVRHGRGGGQLTPEPFEHALADTMEQIVTAMCLPLRLGAAEPIERKDER